MADEVIIRDDAGTEHVFPAGFDVQKAIGIVRASSSTSSPGMRDAAMRAIARDAGGLGIGMPAVTDELGRTPEPDTFWGGVGKSLKDQVLGATVGNPILQGAAHPSSFRDLGSLMIPNAGLSGASLSGALTSTGRAVRAGTDAAISGSKIANGQMPDPSLTRSVVRGVLRFLPAAHQEFNRTPIQLFNDLPLSQQMERFPTLPSPAPGRASAPTLNVEMPGFKDLPLYKQMESIPETVPAPQRTRFPEPPARASSALTPEQISMLADDTYKRALSNTGLYTPSGAPVSANERVRQAVLDALKKQH